MADDSARHEAVLRKWEREEERKKAKAEASEVNFKKTFADQLKRPEVKRSIAIDAQQATKDPSRVATSRNLDELRNRVSYAGYDSDEVITGSEERPWEND